MNLLLITYELLLIYYYDNFYYFIILLFQLVNAALMAKAIKIWSRGQALAGLEG